jgi:hypothetical protein
MSEEFEVFDGINLVARSCTEKRTIRSHISAFSLYTFSLLQIVQTGSEVHPTSYAMGTAAFFPGGKAAGA